MKKKLLFCFLISFCFAKGQTFDTMQTCKQNVRWLIGIDGYSDLNWVSVIAGAETNNRSRYSLSFSNLFGSTRFGSYYDVCVSKSYGFWLGLGYHNSFNFKAFGQSRQAYTDSVVRKDYEHSTVAIGFQPSYWETRWQQFGSFTLMKEFKVRKKFFFSFRVSMVYGYTRYYKHGEFSPNGGIQLYFKI